MANPKKKAAKPKSKSKGSVKRRGTKAIAAAKKKAGKLADADAKAAKKLKGRKLTNAEKEIRDSLIVERRMLGWEWEDIATEAGLSVDQCQRNYRAKIKNLPQLLSMKPMKILEMLLAGFQIAVLDFEMMAQTYAEKNPAAAVGAKKAAVETRKEIATLLQSTGQLPHDLGELRILTDVRHSVSIVIGLVEGFESAMRQIELPPEASKAVEKATGQLHTGLKELAEPKDKAA